MRFVGRRAELSLLRDEGRRVRRSGCRVVLIEGIEGAGKTRLMDEFAAAWVAEGFRYVRVSGVDAPDAPSLWPWYHALVSLGTAETLAPPGAAAGFAERRAYADALAAAGRADPVLVLVDDLHRADQASIALLEHLRDTPPASAVLVVAARRDVGGQETRSPAGITVTLAGLAAAEVAELAADVAGGPPPGPVLNQLYRRTDGNPGLIVQVAAQFAAADPRLAEVGRLPVTWPEPLLAAGQDRLAALCEPARRALTAAAVVGREFDLGLLERLAPMPNVDLSDTDLVDALDEAVRARVITRGPTDVYRFVRSIDREVLCDGLGVRQLAELHDAVAEALLAFTTPGSDRAATAAELAYHAVEAAVLGGAERLDRAIGFAVSAGVAANQQGHADSAAIYHATAAQLANRAGWSPGARGRLMVAAGVAHLASGDRSTGRTWLTGAARLAREHRDAELLAEAALGHGPPSGAGVTATPVDPEVVVMMREALDAPSETLTASLRSRLHCRLAIAEHLSDPRRGESEHLAGALRAAEEGDDPRAVAEAWLALATADADIDLRPALQAATSARDPALECRVRLAAAGQRLHTGDVAGALRELDAVARLDGSVYVRWHATQAAAHRSLLAGDPDRALRLADEARGHGALVCPDGAALVHIVQCAAVRLAQGVPAELAAVLGGSAWSAPRPLWERALAALVAAHRGEHLVAAELLAELLAPSDRQAGRQSALWTDVIAADVALAIGDRSAVPTLLHRLEPYAGRWVVLGPGVASAGPVALVVSRLHLAAADLDAARASLDQATGVPLAWLPHVRLHRARILAAYARTRDRHSGKPDPAVPEARAAHAGASEHGLTGVAEGAEALLQELAGPAGPGLTRREREVAELAIQGLPAREIAVRLVVGERTVETHLANIYRKLNVRSRVELIARFAGGLPEAQA